MDPAAHRQARRIARRFLVRQAARDPAFLEWAEGQRFKSDETGRDNLYQSLPTEQQSEIYQRWLGSRAQGEASGAPQGRAKTPQGRTRAAQAQLDMARNGKVVHSTVLSSGGKDADSRNQSNFVMIEHDGETGMFIHKPVAGEEGNMRLGIPGGQYHAREQAAYAFDELLGGRGVVPVTATRGQDDGSYQRFLLEANAMEPEKFQEDLGKASVADIRDNPDFERVNVLDLILGHQDRHGRNLMWYVDGDPDPENVRLVAIDNGLSIGGEAGAPKMYMYINPFHYWTDDEEAVDPNNYDSIAQQATADMMVGKALSDISDDMISRIRELDLEDVARSLTEAGIDDPAAVRALLVRVAALQADRNVFRDLMSKEPVRHTSGTSRLQRAWQKFQHESYEDGNLLYKSGAGSEAERRIEKALEAATPEGGWEDALSIEQQTQNILAAIAAESAANDPSQNVDDKTTGRDVVAAVSRRWLGQMVASESPSRKLEIFTIDPRSRRRRLAGTFELSRSGRVKSDVRDSLLRRELASGVALPGVRLRPRDGERYLRALQKVYGGRTFYDVEMS